MNQSEYKPPLQWFVEYDLGKDLKVKHKRGVLGLSAIYKEQERFRFQKCTTNDRNNQFIDLSVENWFNRNYLPSN